MHEVLVNRLGGLSLPRKSVVRLTDRPDMTLDVYRGRKTTMQQQQFNLIFTLSLLYYIRKGNSLFRFLHGCSWVNYGIPQKACHENYITISPKIKPKLCNNNVHCRYKVAGKKLVNWCKGFSFAMELSILIMRSRSCQ